MSGGVASMINGGTFGDGFKNSFAYGIVPGGVDGYYKGNNAKQMAATGAKVKQSTISSTTEDYLDIGYNGDRVGYNMPDPDPIAYTLNLSAVEIYAKAPASAGGGSNAMDWVQGGLDVAGLVPGFGEVADGINALIYTARGDYVNAGLSAAAMIPFAGWAATGGKMINKGLKYSKRVDAAKGICYALDIPLLAVSTLQAMALGLKTKYKQENKNTFFCPMIDARRMEVYTALYDSQLKETEAVHAKIIDKDSYAELLKNIKIVFGGDGSKKVKSIIHSENAVFIDTFQTSAKYIAIRASELFKRKHFADSAYFEPLYLKEFLPGKAKVKGLT